jgi:aspartyl aminopeptidase
MENLEYKNENAWFKLSQPEVMDFSESYKEFISSRKTEREVVEFAKGEAEKAGFKDLFSDGYAGEDFFAVNDLKSIFLFKNGELDLSNGINIVVAHIDSPRIDIKQNPLYEKFDVALLKTHYYGGIKKYQWATIPLAIHGVIILKNGEKIELSLGEAPDDPVFVISDLLPHLGRKQLEKPAREVIEGEALDPVVGSIPEKDKNGKDSVKKAVLKILHEEYGLVEEDFISAEITLVPAGAARDVGFDRSAILSYGHDDKICAYAAFRGLLDMGIPKRPALVMLMDKEEIGSEGTTGSQSDFLEYALEVYMKKADIKNISVREVLHRSFALSADVNAAMDPLYADVFEEQNAAKFGHGIVVTKFTGSGGKYNSSDASAELVYAIRELFNENNVPWQIGELGKVDIGGGGTIAKFLAKRGIETIDAGPALLSMHAPHEIASKADLFASYLAYKIFLSNKVELKK